MRSSPSVLLLLFLFLGSSTPIYADSPALQTAVCDGSLSQQWSVEIAQENARGSGATLKTKLISDAQCVQVDTCSLPPSSKDQEAFTVSMVSCETSVRRCRRNRETEKSEKSERDERRKFLETQSTKERERHYTVSFECRRLSLCFARKKRFEESEKERNG